MSRGRGRQAKPGDKLRFEYSAARYPGPRTIKESACGCAGCGQFGPIGAVAPAFSAQPSEAAENARPPAPLAYCFRCAGGATGVIVAS